jgi:hypothetical protein
MYHGVAARENRTQFLQFFFFFHLFGSTGDGTQGLVELSALPLNHIPSLP